MDRKQIVGACLFVCVVAALVAFLIDRSHKEIVLADAMYEAKAVKSVRAHVVDLKKGMTITEARLAIFSNIENNPNSGMPLKTWYSSEFGRRSLIAQTLPGEWLIIDFAIEPSAPLDANGHPKSEDDWRLERFGYSDKPYLQ